MSSQTDYQRKTFRHKKNTCDKRNTRLNSGENVIAHTVIIMHRFMNPHYQPPAPLFPVRQRKRIGVK